MVIKFNIKNYTCSIEISTLLLSLFFVLTCNYSFWTSLARDKDMLAIHTWFMLLFMAIAITGLQWFLLLLVVNRWTFRWVIIPLCLVTSLVVYFTSTFHIYVDPSMMVNVLNTDLQESKEFLQWRILPYFLFLGVLPSWIVWHVKIDDSRLVNKLSMFFLALIMFFGGTWAVFYDFGPVLRERSDLRYLYTPLNVIYSSIKIYLNTHQSNPQKIIIGEDARQALRPLHSKPRVIVLVVGETVRASNWGLNHYKRQTTPELAKHAIINFSQVTSCGTSTAISLPCMFSPYGMHDYNHQNINNTESLLHLLNRTKISVLWRDNQAGCQGVCVGLPFEKIAKDNLCGRGRCLDEVLLYKLKKLISAKQQDQIIVLHMLGNHGPAYFERYPPQFKRWLPICETTDLSRCSQQSIINTYDNVILYTDTILARAIDILSAIKTHDTGLIYLSDHGESLGEYNLFLHGLPYFIAPEEQKKVPMIFWLSKGLSQQLRVKEHCLLTKQSIPISHDYLFSTVLGLFGIETSVYKSKFDLTASCRSIS